MLSVQVVHARDSMSVQTVSAGPPLIVVGGPQLGHQYMRRLDVLAEHFRLVYFDARGSSLASGQTERSTIPLERRSERHGRD